jgi:hypothetical protein
MSERGRRIGLNEAVFREVNERIEKLADSFDFRDEPLDLVCECGDAECVERISMTRDAYEAVRRESHRFAVYPGHELPDVETVVERHKTYHVVAKNHGEPKIVAEETDPRRA